MAKPSGFDAGYCAGITAALLVILRGHGEDTYAEEIVRSSVDPARLEEFARLEGDEDIVALCGQIRREQITARPAPAGSEESEANQ